jgi:hypothetical protein
MRAPLERRRDDDGPEVGVLVVLVGAPRPGDGRRRAVDLGLDDRLDLRELHRHIRRNDAGSEKRRGDGKAMQGRLQRGERHPGESQASRSPAGYALRAAPVPAPPYVVVTGEGPVVRATVADGWLAVTLRAFEVVRADEHGGTGPRYRRLPDVDVEVTFRRTR